MKITQKAVAVFSAILISGTISATLFVAPVFAATPFLNVTPDTQGNVRLAISNANAYSTVSLTYMQGSSQWVTISNFGTTDANGNLSTLMNSSFDNTTNTVQMYATVGGLQSNTIQYSPSYNNNYNNGNNYNNNYNNYGNVTFNQSAVTLNVGQSMVVYVNNPYPAYISNNSNSYAFSAALSGTALTINALNQGSGTVTLCLNAANYICGTVNVTVNAYSGYNNNGLLSASQTSVSMTTGQTAYITITSSLNYYNNNYYGNNFFISSNSNNLAVSATISGNTVTLRANNPGISILNICQNGTAACVAVTVNATGFYNGYYPGNGGSVLGAVTYQNGAIIQDGTTVYIVFKNTKTAFANWDAFTGLGYNASMIQAVGFGGTSSMNMPYYPISSAITAHPLGSWVKNGSTVYFVSDMGLIPIGDYGTFLNNGGQDRLVVQTNVYDFQKPTLSLMTYSDYRLR